MPRFDLARLVLILLAASFLHSGCVHTFSDEPPIGVSSIWVGFDGRDYVSMGVGNQTDNLLRQDLQHRAMRAIGDNFQRPPKMTRIAAHVSWSPSHQVQVGQFDGAASPFVVDRLRRAIIASFTAHNFQGDSFNRVSKIEKITFVF